MSITTDSTKNVQQDLGRRIGNISNGAPQAPRQVRPIGVAHSGFGFGANTIREKSLEVAMTASAVKESRLKQLLSQPIAEQKPPASAASLNSALTPVVSPIVTPSAITQVHTPTLSHRRNVVVATTKKNIIEKSLDDNAQVEKETKRITTQTLPRTPYQVERTRAVFAWILDTVVTASALVIAMGSNYASMSPEGGTPLVTAVEKISTSLGLGNPFLIIMMLKVTLSALAVLFAGQFGMLLFTGSTAGRFAMGISLEGKSIVKRLFPAIQVAISEVLTLGGILALPMVVAMPSRATLAPWVRFRVKSDN
jgi:hypothetical protein